MLYFMKLLKGVIPIPPAISTWVPFSCSSRINVPFGPSPEITAPILSSLRVFLKPDSCLIRVVFRIKFPSVGEEEIVKCRVLPRGSS